MAKNYYLEWFDLLITVTLNPNRTNLPSIPEHQIEAIKKQIVDEKIECRYR
jgi:hypothetical protein